MNVTAKPSHRMLLALGLGALGLVGCTSMGTETGLNTGVGVSAGTATTVRLNDMEVAGVIATVNNTEIMAARMALQKSDNGQVRQYAETMLRDHGGLNDAILRLAQQMSISPQESPLSRQMAATGQGLLSQLNSLNGAAFDRAYIQGQVVSHQAALAAIDNVLVPSTQNANLRSALVAGRPAVAAHLQQALNIRASLM